MQLNFLLYLSAAAVTRRGGVRDGDYDCGQSLQDSLGSLMKITMMSLVECRATRIN